jgi:cytochrome P450
MTPPKPASRPRRVSFWRYLQLFRRDILSAQPAHLYNAKMAEYRTPFFRSVLINEPALIRTVLRDRPEDFPKSMRIAEGLRPLLGQSIFVTNGDIWARQRRIIDPAFEGGRIKDSFPAMLAAARQIAGSLPEGEQDIEPAMSKVTADVIFRAMFSLPIDDDVARRIFAAFQQHQRAQPLLNLGAFLALPEWFPRGHGRAARRSAATIRHLLAEVTSRRRSEIDSGTAPDDLATKIMTTSDPETGDGFSDAEVADQLAIFFLAGHETSASALAWTLYLLACEPDLQTELRKEVQEFVASPDFSGLSALELTRDVIREALRLYPPVPMMVREAKNAETMRDRTLPKGCQVVISPWHLHRNPRHWSDPDAFCPQRWAKGGAKPAQRDAYLPFSAGPRVCPGAGFAMAEAAVILSHLVARFEFAPVDGATPVPVAHLTVRGREGIRISVSRHDDESRSA